MSADLEQMTDAERNAATALGALLNRAASISPGLRRKVLGVIKEAAPNYPIPDVDLEAQVIERVQAAVKPHEESTTALASEVRELKTQLARRDMQHKLGLDEDELVEVETLAKDKKIGDVETAKEFYEMRNQILGTPRATRDPGAEDYQSKLRKINPRNHAALKRAAIDEGARITRSIRRAG